MVESFLDWWKRVTNKQDINSYLLNAFDKEDKSIPIIFPPKPEIQKPTPIELFLKIAQSYIGVVETSDNSGKEVEMFQKSVDGKAQREPWCCAYVQYVIKEVETKLNIKSKIFKSEHCLTVWDKTDKSLRLDKPESGCLVIWKFGNTTNGHVGIVDTVAGSRMFTIEGNTGPSSEVEREGDGVYGKDRSIKGTAKMTVVGFLKVF